MRDVTSTGSTPSRRLVTAGALGVAVAVLAGCGIRLEDDAPRLPLVPERSPIEGEEALVRLLVALQAAALVPPDPKAPISTLLAPLHARQATVLHDALRQRGVPADELAAATSSPSASPTVPSATGTPAPSATGTSAPSATGSSAPSATGPSSAPAPPTVAGVETSIIAAGSGVSVAKADLRPTLLSLLAQAHAAIDLVGAAPPPPTSSPSPSWSRPDALAPLITAVRTATYFLEVAAARSTKKVRTVELEGLARLHTLTAELVEAAGDAAPVPDLGQPLPHRVETVAEAKILTTEALTTLLSTFGSHLPTLGEQDAQAAFAKVPQWLGTVAAQANRHGIPLTAFPGLA